MVKRRRFKQAEELRRRVRAARIGRPDLNCEEIGQLDGINLTKSRVWQILKEAGLPTRNSPYHLHHKKERMNRGPNLSDCTILSVRVIGGTE